MKKTSATPMIEISNLKKFYGDFEAIKGISFSVPKGQVVGFLGPNGAGKSTTMKILTGYLPYMHGSVKINGLEVSKNSQQTKELIGYLPENNPQYEDMMVYEYLAFIANIRKIPKKYVKSKVERVVELCGLFDVFRKDIGQLSKGYRQRVGLAQAILHEPKLLILDEPTSGLDPNQIVEIRKLITELGKTSTVLMSTHILQEAQSSCQRVIIINDGMLAADDDLERLSVQGEASSVLVSICDASEKAVDYKKIENRLREINGIVGIEINTKTPVTMFQARVMYEGKDPRKDIFHAVVDLNHVLVELSQKRVSLEDTFRKLTK